MPYTSLLGLSLPTTGSLAGTWGDEVNNAITSLLDSAVAGTTTLSTDADVTLTSTDGVSNQARSAILLWTAGGSVTRNITAPARSKAYIVINATSGSQSIVVRGAGPTTGVTVAAGTRVLVAWNGTDFVKIAGSDYLTAALGNTAVTGFKTATFNSQTTIATTTGAITVDWTSAQNQKQTEPTGTITYTFTAPPGVGHLQLLIDSDGTSTAQTINWPGTVIFFGTTWAGVANKKAIINFWYDGTNYYAIGTNQV